MKRYQTSESLPVGLLLALAGGILDAYTYLNRGQVFATAETGNLVLLGINLSQGKLDRVVYYLLPILSFAAGVLVTELLRRRLGPNAGHLHWRQPVLLTECLVRLGVDPRIAAEDACRMEHVISQESFEQIKAHMGKGQK